ncbi:hypothetical protein ACLB2K_056130 [Fragaria x ananassa]
MDSGRPCQCLRPNSDESIVSLLSVEHVKRTVPFSVEPSFPDAFDASNDGFIWIGSRGEGARWLSGSNQKESSSIRRLHRWAGDVEVESEHVKVKSEEAEVEAELEVWIGSRGEGARWLSGSNQKASSSIKRLCRWAGDVEVESEEAEAEAELEVVVDGIRRSRGVNVKLAASRSRRHRWPAALRSRLRRRHRRRSSRSASSYHRRVSVGLRRSHGRRFKIGEEREEEDDEPERERV